MVVAGHICVDVIPAWPGRASAIRPGVLLEVGPATIASGGAVANVGLCLKRLGVPVALCGRIGDDLLGRALHEILCPQGVRVDLQTVIGETTSYSVVISPPGVDRSFLHCPGANERFDPDALDLTPYRGSKILHFGYPQIMQRTFADGGEALRRLFERARRLGLWVSLDTAMPDPQSPAGRADWGAFFRRVLPWVDIFAPSVDELCAMLGRPRPALAGGSKAADPTCLSALADDMLALGPALVLFKLGADGLYLRTAADRARIDRLACGLGLEPAAWSARERLGACFQVDVVGTTGAGDTTVAGFLAALLARKSPRDALDLALAVGACCCQAADALGGIRPVEEVVARLAAGWPRRPTNWVGGGWRCEAGGGQWVGPGETARPST